MRCIFCGLSATSDVLEKGRGPARKKQVFREEFAIIVRIQHKESEQRIT